MCAQIITSSLQDNPDKKSLKELQFTVLDDDGVKRSVPALVNCLNRLITLDFIKTTL